MDAPPPLPPASGPARPRSTTETNSAKVIQALRQQEARLDQRTDDVIAQLHLARAEAARLRQDTQQHLQAAQQTQRTYEQLQRDYELLRSLLQASQDALMRGQPLTPAQQHEIDAALHPGGSATNDKLAA